jgi:hypothetical protein
VVIAPQGQVTPAGIMPRLKQFTVVGIFEVGMFEYDSGLALIHLEDAEKLYRMNDEVSGVRSSCRTVRCSHGGTRAHAHAGRRRLHHRLDAQPCELISARCRSRRT